MKTKQFLRHSLMIMVSALIICFAAQAQRYTGYFNQAEELFNTHNYYEASQVYERYLATEKNSRPKSQAFAVEKKVKGKANLDPHEEAVYHLAECYRMIHNYEKAEKYYKESTSFSLKAYPASRYWYAVTLRTNQKYADAFREISLFLEKHTQLDDLLQGADRELENLRFIQAQSENISEQFTITPYSVGKNKSAYALTLKDSDEVAFTMVKEDSGKNGQAQYSNVLFESAQRDDPFPSAKGIEMYEHPGENSGMATFTRDGKHMFFTRWTRTNGKTQSSIYMSHQTDTGWSQPMKAPPPLNLEASNNAQPFLTADAHYVIFSSDRPGGSGGYDLWDASLDSNLDVIQVQNLGNIINTAGDEEAPYFHTKSRTLVFSTNGRVGMGGFDLFFAKGNFDLSDWEKPENAGAPLNSPKDDLYYVSTDDEFVWNTGWVSSDRSSACCLALFSVRENNASYVSGSVIDCKTGKPVDRALLTVTDIRHPDRLLNRLQTDSAGYYAFEIRNTAHFKISVNKPGYEKKIAEYDLQMIIGKDSMSTGSICVKTAEAPDNEVSQLLKSLTRTSRLGNFAYKKAILNDSALDNLDSLAKMMQKYPQMVIQVEGYTDSIGGSAYNKRLAQRRVDACIKYLIKRGVPANRLIGKGMGECCPIEPETINGKDNPAGREVNRRVEYKVVRAP